LIGHEVENDRMERYVFWGGDGFIFDLGLLGLNVPNRSYDVNGLMHALLET
jgi:hypothetical protein